MLTDFTYIQFEETPERLKFSWPLRRQGFLLGLFSLTLLVWLVMLVGMAIYLVRDVMLAGERFSFVFSVMLLIWLAVWIWFGRVLWRRWQYYAANREILFINQEQMIIRRPVSILGLTDGYDMQHVSPFYYSDKHHCPVFDYGYQHVYFGHALPQDDAEKLVGALNGRFFPHLDDD
jgi:hypothetical protein